MKRTTKQRQSKDKKEDKEKERVECGELFVQIIRGEDLVAMDDGVSSDPFVVLRLGTDPAKPQKKWSTRVVAKNLNPVWNEGTSFAIPTDKEEEYKVR
jgi:Ca2+-dependent lipid-binding protein